MHTVRQDEHGWTHIDWTLNDVTPNMIDWHWSHMEKDYNLWHPAQHKDFSWVVPPTAERFLGAIHSAPQTRADGTFKVPKLRYDDIAELKDVCKPLIVYDHVVVVSCVTLGDDDVPNDGPAQSYRIHQWQASDNGVVGMSSAISWRGEGKEAELKSGRLWSLHAAEEIENFANFLPDLYNMWRRVTDPRFNFTHCLRVEKTGSGFRYTSL